MSCLPLILFSKPHFYSLFLRVSSANLEKLTTSTTDGTISIVLDALTSGGVCSILC